MRLWLLLCFVLIGDRNAFPAPLPGQSPAQVAPVDQDLERVKALKLRALQALDDDKPEEAEKYYREVLRIAPDDPLANQSLKEIREKRNKAREDSINDRLASEDQAARDKAVANAAALADSYLLRAKQSNSSDDLAKARTARDAARKAAGSAPYVSLDALDARIESEASRQNLRWWEFWGGLGVVGLASLVGLGFYFWRRRRVLEMIHGPQPGQVFVLRQELTRVGALAGEVDWAINDPYRKVSRHHCDVVRSRRHYFVVDCSTNGTFLNSRPLVKGEPVLLRRGDLLGLGSEVTLRFQ